MSIIYFWETMLIEDSTVLKQLLYCYCSKLGFQQEFAYLEEIMKQDKLLKFMDFMLNARANMVLQRYGSNSLMCLIFFQSEQLSTIEYLQYMEGLAQLCIQSMILRISTDFKKFRMRVHLQT